MTKTILDPALELVRLISEQEIKLVAADHTDNQGEPCDFCDRPASWPGWAVNTVTLYGYGDDGEQSTRDCCIRCAPAVASQYFNPLYGVIAEVARG